MLPIQMIIGFILIFISIFFLDVEKKPLPTIFIFIVGIYIAIKSM